VRAALSASVTFLRGRSALSPGILDLGFETARQLVAAGRRVWIGARDKSRGQQAADAIGGRFVQLDVSNAQGL
jgi:NADP-dependent 3-hydroxy acid dehydrogenase YdfG